MIDPKLRFSSCVENYIKYRPSYSQALLNTLKNDCRLDESSLIANIGSGNYSTKENVDW
ncbi:MAG: hypothetical protein WA705_02160 [Candidatus Ozemobacteraceae bacterium]